mgnify:FL=1
MTNPFKFKDMKIKEFEVFQTCDIEIIEQVKRYSEYLAVYLAKDIKSNEIIPIVLWDNNSTLTPGKYLLVPSSTGKSASVVKRD